MNTSRSSSSSSTLLLQLSFESLPGIDFDHTHQLTNVFHSCINALNAYIAFLPKTHEHEIEILLSECFLGESNVVAPSERKKFIKNSIPFFEGSLAHVPTESSSLRRQLNKAIREANSILHATSASTIKRSAHEIQGESVQGQSLWSFDSG